MKSLLIAVAAGLFGSAFSLVVAGQAQVVKTPSAVAFVSASRVISETTQGRSQAGRIQAMQQQRATDLKAKQQALEATRQQVLSASDGTRAELQQKELQQRTELERATQQAQVDLQNLQREINADLQQRVRATLDDLMKTQTYQVVFNSDANVLWAEPALDLTSAVVGKMNGQP